MNVGKNVDLWHGAIRAGSTASAFERINHRDTFAAREWLRAVTQEARLEYVDVPAPPALRALVAVVDYNPEEIWSLTVMLGQLMELEPSVEVEVVVVAEGRRWALPVLVADFPRLTMVPPGPTGQEALSGILQRMVREHAAPNLP
ncbi:hypothetical protein [Arthrobacter sp. SLBN-100]|uniref:hypothetical protein n=1 Tax=Arthrobacter sp. SLBN-100 TaxID=2768450 RepID=UPI00114D8726|nr:hypothetical protein [Arthrobacter sp. SLBN-100]